MGGGVAVRAIFVALAIAAAGCVTPPPPVPPPPAPHSLAICSSALLAPPAPTDVCSELFTADGWACVSCTGAVGCLDTIDGIYCSDGPCVSDPACARRAGARRKPPIK
jgi:hypothetical protein